jgi:tRNA dimethylallyltransferase
VKVIILSGPTASGKTSISLELAQRFGGEVVNFDSLLLYREINIGTAKPDQRERQLVPHHMIDVASISDPMNAADYARVALPVVQALLQQQKLVYLVGGSGFYLQALLKGMYESSTTPLEIQQRSQELYETQGIAPFREILQQHDRPSFERYHENDHYRIRRAVEHWWSVGTRFSDERSRKDEGNQMLPESNIHGWETLHLYLDLPKAEHLQIIESRTRLMLQSGLLTEVEQLLQQGFSGKEKPLQSIGYRETLDYLAGKFPTLEECVERIIISTRQLAKSQRTWFKKDNSKKQFHPLRQKDLILAEVEKFLNA